MDCASSPAKNVSATNTVEVRAANDGMLPRHSRACAPSAAYPNRVGSMSAQRYLLRKAVLAPSFHAVPSGLLQRKCACGQHTIAGRECKECSKKREVRLQRAAVSSPLAGSVPPLVHEVLRSPGQPLDAATRAFMEPRFGHDFSTVPTHANASAPTPGHLTIGAPHDEFE